MCKRSCNRRRNFVVVLRLSFGTVTTGAESRPRPIRGRGRASTRAPGLQPRRCRCTQPGRVT
eukprot:419097-Hanusia_phi.AAC.1